jgi:hypothetical protein
MSADDIPTAAGGIKRAATHQYAKPKIAADAVAIATALEFVTRTAF